MLRPTPGDPGKTYLDSECKVSHPGHFLRFAARLSAHVDGSMNMATLAKLNTLSVTSSNILTAEVAIVADTVLSARTAALRKSANVLCAGGS